MKPVATLDPHLNPLPKGEEDAKRPVRVVWRILDAAVGMIFVFAGLTKIFDLDGLITDVRHLRFADFLVHIQHVQFNNPMGFAGDIDNYKIQIGTVPLPWAACVGLAFYLPWLEILCGLFLIFRILYRGAMSILLGLISIFLIATVAAKVRGLDITCGCFGHASQNWNFSAHLAFDFILLAALLFLAFGRDRVSPVAG